VDLLERIELSAFVVDYLLEHFELRVLVAGLVLELPHFIFVLMYFVDQGLAQLLHEVTHLGLDVPPQDLEGREVLG